MQALENFLYPIVVKMNEYLSSYILIVLLIAVGLWYTIKTRFVQIRCFKEGMKKADPVIKEPIMLVNVIMPDEYMGDVMGDLNSRRGMIKSQESRSGGVTQVTANVPLSEMFGYATVLRSGTQGRGQYTMEPSHYSEVPRSIQEKIISDRAK